MYFGFSYRTELIKNNIPKDAGKVALEVGIGTGHSLISLSRRFEKIYGFDVSEESVQLLKNKIREANIQLETVDICSDFDKRYENMFDFIFSADTLEHVNKPGKFFENIGRLLKEEATAIISFPNESRDNCHGISCFDTKEDFLKIIPPELRVIRICEVTNAGYFDFILNYLWLRPRELIKSQKKAQTFEETSAFSLNARHPFLANVLAIYPAVLLQIAKLGEMFKYKELKSGNISSKYLLIEVKKNRVKL